MENNGLGVNRPLLEKKLDERRFDMKKKYCWTIWRHLILSLGITFLTQLSELIAFRLSDSRVLTSILNQRNSFAGSEAMSIGIIGGADGPTAIFVAGKILPLLLLNPQVILFIVLMLLYLPMKAYMNRVLGRQE